VSGLDGRTGNRWQFQNPFGKQRVRVRIEALLSLAPYEADGEVAAAFTDAGEFNLRQSSGGTTGTLFSVASPAKAGGHSGCLAARTEQANRRTAWTMAGKTFAQPVSLLERGFGVWVHGDGKGEVLNFQWRAPEHLSSGVSEHYATIDFTGWRYFEFVEPESDRLLDYGWPYFYTNPDREFSGTNGWEHWNLSPGTFWVDYARLDSLKLWYNNLPKGEEVRCLLSPVKILPHVKARLVNPSVEVGGRTIVFPVELESGSYLEFRSWEDCKVYDAKGAFVRDVTPKGESPLATAGANTVRFNCRVTGATTPRANVTIITQGDHPVGAP
jgi:hypothetical protein